MHWCCRGEYADISFASLNARAAGASLSGRLPLRLRRPKKHASPFCCRSTSRHPPIGIFGPALASMRRSRTPPFIRRRNSNSQMAKVPRSRPGRLCIVPPRFALKGPGQKHAGGRQPRQGPKVKAFKVQAQSPRNRVPLSPGALNPERVSLASGCRNTCTPRQALVLTCGTLIPTIKFRTFS